MTVLTGPQRVRHPLVPRRAQVVRLTSLGARMRRVTFRLSDRDPPIPWVTRAVADHVKLVLPDPLDGLVRLPEVVDDRIQRSTTFPQMTTRDYTVRAVPDDRHVVVDMIAHGSGPASTWLAGAKTGAEVGLLGPRGSRVEPAAPAYVVLVDETGIPAASRLVEEAPRESAVTAVVQIFDAEGMVDLPARPGVDIHWLLGTATHTLAAQLRVLAPLKRTTLVWAAGETGAMRALRHAATEVGLTPEQQRIDGYFRWGASDFDHHAP
ncbi:MAG: siderophore-interacting protein [Ornithinimicrobium sp.]